MTHISRFMIPSIVLFMLAAAVGAEATPPSNSAGDHTRSSAERTKPATLIDINSATLTDLRSLPGIGNAHAHKIVAGRPYTSVDDLKARKVLPISTFDKIRDRIGVKAAAGTAVGDHQPPRGTDSGHH
jgi:hypothetical protein